MAIFWQFLRKNGNFLAIFLKFLRKNSNFPESQIQTGNNSPAYWLSRLCMTSSISAKILFSWICCSTKFSAGDVSSEIKG